MQPNIETLRVLRVFIGSPGDLIAERKMFPGVIERVNRIKAKPMGILLEPVSSADTLPGRGRPQKNINENLIKSSHLIVLLLWKRWGKPTGKYSSGFEEEYVVADENDKDLWLQFRRDIPDYMLVEPDEQLKKVLEFRKRVAIEKKFTPRWYDHENMWKDQLYIDLCDWLDRLPPATIQGPRPRPRPFPTDKLENKVKQLEKEIQQIKAAYALAREGQEREKFGYITDAQQYFAKALARHGAPSILNEYGSFLMRIGALEEAQEKFTQSIHISEITGYERAHATIAYTNLGMLYEAQGKLKAAEEMYKKSLAINEKLGRKEATAEDYANLSLLYEAQGNLKAAEEMYKKSLGINEKLGRKGATAEDYTNLGILYEAQGNLKAAEEMYKKSLAINEKLGRREGIADNYTNLGILYRTRGDLPTAEEMYKKSLAINEKLGRKEEIANNYGTLGNLYLTQGDLPTAEEMYKKSLAINEKLGRKEGMAKDYTNLITCGLYLNRYDKAMVRKIQSLIKELRSPKRRGSGSKP
ncbi:Photosystem I assembly protein Ycf3 [subsurface metagenome]